MRENEGYKIISTVELDPGQEIVIGRQETQYGTMYVCWYCYGGDNYFWGGYTENYKGVLSIFSHRLKGYLGE